MYEGCPAWTDNPNHVEEADWLTKHYSSWLIIQDYIRKIKKSPRRGEKKNGLPASV